MNNRFFLLLSVLPILLFATLSCGGGGGGSVAGGGIGGTGISVASLGPVTAIGSITVNGVKYETTGAQVSRDGVLVDDDQLEVGMVVSVQGALNADGTTGTADFVTIDDSVEGPITGIAGNVLIVLGQNIVVDDTTVFDETIMTGLPGLAVGDIIEVSGQLDELGSIRATRIEKKAPGGNFEVTGFIIGKIGTIITINNLTVDISTATLENFGSLQPAVGDYVEVVGSAFNPVTGDFIAIKVEKKNRVFDDGEEVEAEGFVTVANGSTFTLNTPSGPLAVQTDGTTEFEGGVLADIKVGGKLEVEGQISGGILIADEVSFRESIKLSGVAATVDSGAQTLTLFGLPIIVVQLNDQTRIDDERSVPANTSNLSAFLDTIQTDEAIDVRARLDSAGGVVAAELEVDDIPSNRDAVTLQGPVDSTPTDTNFVQILGVTVDTSGTTQ
jgi:hypothetical protein